jgi:CHAD domain-containing protein
MDGSYRLLAARYVRKQTRQLLKQLDGVRQSDDIECVHQARVASRRLRAGLRLFPECFPGKKVKRWRRKIRRLAQSLGPARDKDVQIEFVSGVLSELDEKSHRAGIERLLLRLKQGREAVQPSVVHAVDAFEASGVGGQMLAAAEKTRSKLKKRHLSVQSPFVFSQAQGHICDRLNELMRYEDCLGDPEDEEHHHAMRIAAKRLRYTMEICQPAYEGRLDESVSMVKGLQTLLGDIHDCDVWVEHLEAFLTRERERTVVYYGNARPFRALKPGLEYLHQERRSRREELFGQLVEYWRELDQAGRWEKLVETVRSPTEPSGDSEPSAEARHHGGGRKPSARRSRGDGKAVSDKPNVEDLKHQAPRAAQPAVKPAGDRPKVGSDGRETGQQGTLLGGGKPGAHGQ